MIKIENLEVRFEVDGGPDSDEALFAQLFEKYVNRWTRARELAAARHRLTRANCSLADQTTADHG